MHHAFGTAAVFVSVAFLITGATFVAERLAGRARQAVVSEGAEERNSEPVLEEV
jgi:hypothetical protein